MVKTDKYNDNFFKDLFKSERIEKAPEGFTDKVMNAIDAETDQVAVKSNIFSMTNWWMWLSIAIALGGLVTVVFFVDFSFMGSIFSGVELDGSRIAQFVQYIGVGLVSAFEDFSVSSISITIFFALSILIFADRIFRKKPKVEVNLI